MKRSQLLLQMAVVNTSLKAGGRTITGQIFVTHFFAKKCIIKTVEQSIVILAEKLAGDEELNLEGNGNQSHESRDVSHHPLLPVLLARAYCNAPFILKQNFSIIRSEGHNDVIYTSLELKRMCRVYAKKVI